jgi:hypothetical protein
VEFKQISEVSLHTYTQALIKAYDEGFKPQATSDTCPRVLGNGIFYAMLMKEVPDEAVKAKPATKKAV